MRQVGIARCCLDTLVAQQAADDPFHYSNVAAALGTHTTKTVEFHRENTLPIMDDDLRSRLEELSHAANRALVEHPNYYPTDILFWSHRNAFSALPRRSSGEASEEGEELLLRMASFLDTASQMHTLPEKQQDRRRKREIQFEQLLGDFYSNQCRAVEEAEKGQFTRLILFARSQSLSDNKNRDIKGDAQHWFLQLWRFAPPILEEEYALPLLQLLWVRGSIGQSSPRERVILAPCLPKEFTWAQLEQITTKRVELGDPASLFYHAVAMGQMGAVVEAHRWLEDHAHRQEPMGAARLQPFLFVVQDDGSPKKFKAIRMSSYGSDLMLMVEEFGWEFRMQRSFAHAPSMLAQIERPDPRRLIDVPIHLAFSHVGVVAIPADWQPQSQGRSRLQSEKVKQSEIASLKTSQPPRRKTSRPGKRRRGG